VITVKFLGPFNKDSIQLESNKVKTIDDLALILQEDESVSSELLNLSAIAINDEIISDKRHQLKSQDVVSVLPPVCGG
jgi:molybdopterin synthase sulfur carrier subunit